MLTVVWDPTGFHLVDAMPKGEKYCARSFLDKIVAPICERLIPQVRES
jgi:hypothetical protein